MGDGPSAADRHRSLRAVLHRRLLKQTEALLTAEQRIRAGEAKGTHGARVASRRLRSVLRTFKVAFDTEASEPLRAELRWLTHSLGHARDQHVARERLITLSDTGEVRGLRLEPTSEVEPLAVVDSHRYVVLVEELTRFVSEPPWTGDAERKARPLVRKAVKREWKRLARRVARVTGLEAGGDVDEGLHEARKAARRTRYALEVAETLWRRKPKRLRKQVVRLSDILGEHQDTVVTRTALRELMAQAESAGEPTSALRRLDRAEEVRARELTVEFRRAWSAAEQRREDWP